MEKPTVNFDEILKSLNVREIHPTDEILTQWGISRNLFNKYFSGKLIPPVSIVLEIIAWLRIDILDVFQNPKFIVNHEQVEKD